MSDLNFEWVAKYAIFMLLAVLAGCGDQLDNIKSQKWQGVDVHIETRPSPPRIGMNEILVLTTNERGQPVYDLVVSIRTSDEDQWIQAIEDGQMGVYRRAAEIAPGVRSTVQVQITRSGEVSVLRFPLAVSG